MNSATIGPLEASMVLSSSIYIIGDMSMYT